MCKTTVSDTNSAKTSKEFEISKEFETIKVSATSPTAYVSQARGLTQQWKAQRAIF